jgi:hypothetical protein
MSNSVTILHPASTLRPQYGTALQTAHCCIHGHFGSRTSCASSGRHCSGINENWYNNFTNEDLFAVCFWGDSPPMGHGLLNHEVSRSHKRHTTLGKTPLYEKSARRRDLYLTKLTTDIDAFGEIRTPQLSRRAAADLRHRPRGHYNTTVPLQAWSGPEGSRKLRFPDFITTPHDGGKVVKPYSPAAFTPRKCSWYSFLLEAEPTPGS